MELIKSIKTYSTIVRIYKVKSYFGKFQLVRTINYK